MAGKKKKKTTRIEEKIKRLIEENEEVNLIKELSRLRKTLPSYQPIFVPDQNNYYRF